MPTIKLMTRNAMELAIVGVGAHLRLDKDGKTCQEARIALGAVAPTPIRAHLAEEVLNNQVIDEDLAGKAGKVASSEASPISNVRASKEYRMEMIAVLTKRAVMEAYQRIRAKSKALGDSVGGKNHERGRHRTESERDPLSI